MFCANCGKEIIGNEKFCHYCGAEQTATVIPAASAPVSADTESSVPISAPAAPSEQLMSMPEAPEAASAPSEQLPSMFEAPDSTSAPAIPSEQLAALPKPINTQAAVTESSVPTPNSIPTSNIEGSLSAASGIPSYPPINAKKIKEPRERKYTLGHLVMCLVTAGIMAIAAGIFAGLYFSVI